MGNEAHSDADLSAWLSSELLSTEVQEPEDGVLSKGDPEVLAKEAAVHVAQYIVTHFPEIVRYITLASAKSKALGYRELRSVGKLDAPIEVIFGASRALLGDAGGRDLSGNLKIAEEIGSLAGVAKWRPIILMLDRSNG